MKKDERELEKTDVIEESAEDITDHELDDADVTRNINLDDLYDGAVNNTVLIDPVTKDEILMENRKPNTIILGIILAIIILLCLYYINNKSDLFRVDEPVKPVSTTTSITKNTSNGLLTCKYLAKSDNETEEVTYSIDYKDEKIIKSNFMYNVVITSDQKSVVAKDKENQYEELYTSNSNLKGLDVEFSKSSKGFSFEATIDYDKVNFDQIAINEEKTVLFIKPSKFDTVSSIRTNYDKKGYKCTITGNTNEK